MKHASAAKRCCIFFFVTSHVLQTIQTAASSSPSAPILVTSTSKHHSNEGITKPKKKRRKRKIASSKKSHDIASLEINPLDELITDSSNAEKGHAAKPKGTRRRRRKSTKSSSVTDSTVILNTPNALPSPSESKEELHPLKNDGPAPSMQRSDKQPSSFLEENESAAFHPTRSILVDSNIKVPIETNDVTAICNTDDVDQGNKKRKRRRKITEIQDGPTTIIDATSDGLLRPIADESEKHDDLEVLDDDDDGAGDDFSTSNASSDSRTKMDQTIYNEAPKEQHVPSESLFESHEDFVSQSSPSLSFSRDETTETMSIHDKTNVDAPITWESTNHQQEETIHSVIQDDFSEDALFPSTDPIGEEEKAASIKTTIKSSQKYEHIKVSNNKSNGQGITIKMHRQRKEQSVHITRTNDTGNNDSSDASLVSPKKESPLNTRTKSTKSTIAAAAARGGKGGECLRRIKSEWRDAVQMGIAYDWVSMRTIRSSTSRSTSTTSNSSSNNHDYVRIGPFGKNLLRWHFSVQGPANSVYEDGIYHGRVLLPKDYPGSPPRVQVSDFSFELE